MKILNNKLILGFIIFFFFTGCTPDLNKEINNTNNLTQKNSPKILNNSSMDKKNLSIEEIKKEKLINISDRINKSSSLLFQYENYLYNFSCSYKEDDYLVEITEYNIKNCGELKDSYNKLETKLDNLYDKKRIIRTNTRGIINFSSIEIEQLPFEFEILNINPSVIRFNLETTEKFSIFIIGDNYECLYLNNSFESGVSDVINQNNCFLNTSKNIDLILEYDDKIKRFSIVPDKNLFNFTINKEIISPSHPNLYGSNITWNLKLNLKNSNQKNSYKLINITSWVSQRNINGSYTEPDIVDFDPISNELLEKNFGDILLGPNEELSLNWKFNYSDIPSPIVWSNFAYYYEIK